MLAYVFWHWPNVEMKQEAYEVGLGRFHSSLRTHPPKGFSESAVLSVSGASWLPGGTGYEDWYGVADFQAIGLLNDSAVTAERQEPHDAIARAAAGGSAGIYRLRAGEFVPKSSSAEFWFGKPAGMQYEELFSLLSPVLGDSESSLWQRQMVLGPTPEFCVQARTKLQLPGQLKPLVVPVRRVWP